MIFHIFLIISSLPHRHREIINHSGLGKHEALQEIPIETRAKKKNLGGSIGRKIKNQEKVELLISNHYGHINKICTVKEFASFVYTISLPSHR